MVACAFATPRINPTFNSKCAVISCSEACILNPTPETKILCRLPRRSQGGCLVDMNEYASNCDTLLCCLSVRWPECASNRLSALRFPCRNWACSSVLSLLLLLDVSWASNHTLIHGFSIEQANVLISKLEKSHGDQDDGTNAATLQSLSSNLSGFAQRVTLLGVKDSRASPGWCRFGEEPLSKHRRVERCYYHGCTSPGLGF